jgi:hypothetical protein
MEGAKPFSLMHSALFGIRDRCHNEGKMPQKPILELLAQTSIPVLGTNIRSQCKGPHERIFGLLGTASDKDTLAIIPAYN